MTKERADHPDTTDQMVRYARSWIADQQARAGADRKTSPTSGGTPQLSSAELDQVAEFLQFLVALGGNELDTNTHPLARQVRAVADMGRQELKFIDTLDALEAVINFKTWGRRFLDGSLPMDTGKRSHLAARIKDRHLFRDVEAEFHVWAQLDRPGQSPMLVEEASKPDIYLPEADIWVEVKRVMPGTNPRNLSKRLSKASKRAKELGGNCGLVMYISRSMLTLGIGDQVPEDVQPYQRYVDSQLRTHPFSGLRWAHLVWDAAPAYAARHGRAMVWNFVRQQTRLDARPIDDITLSDWMIAIVLNYPAPVLPPDQVVAGSTELVPFNLALSGKVV